MFSALVVIGVVALDQITKILVDIFIERGEKVKLFPHVLGLTHTRNRGAAFGALADNRWVFMVLSVVAIVGIIFIMRKIKGKNKLFDISLAFMLGGGIGNMIDRIIRGDVVDFFEVLFMKFAVFNVADSFLTIGAVMMCVYLVFFERKETGMKENGDGQD